jgi:hypothetical protein
MNDVGEKLEGFKGVSQIGVKARGVMLELTPEDWGRVLEIGSYDGVTIAWMAKHRPRCEFTSVDLVQGRGFHHLQNWYENRQPNMALFVGTSFQFERYVKPGVKYDLIIVDGDHTREGVHRDLIFGAAHLNPLGRIVCHDYGLGEKKPHLAPVTEGVDGVVGTGRLEMCRTIGSICVLRIPKMGME